MPDELYLKRESVVPDEVMNECRIVRYDPAGFTLADVRRLARCVGTLKVTRNVVARDDADKALAPFASLLKEKNDAQ
jgi:hypothetical protein